MSAENNGYDYHVLVPEDAKKILHSIASSWDDVVDAREWRVEGMNGAMTNGVFQVIWPTTQGKAPRKVILRIYEVALQVFYDRSDEIAAFVCMSNHGLGPQLLGQFSTGRVEQFLHARTLSASDLRDREISAMIATKLRKLHDLDMPGPKNIVIWDKLKKWFDVTKRLCSTKEIEALRLDAIAMEISTLENKLRLETDIVGFCHNDLQHGNIMIDDENKSLTIIDYEYAGYNPIGYDLANHFCEMVAEYNQDAIHNINYNKYPDLKELQRFVWTYLRSSGKEPSEDEVQHLIQDVKRYTPVCHLHWGLWAILFAKVSVIDFNCIEYGTQRLQQYWSSKHTTLWDDSKDIADGTSVK